MSIKEKLETMPKKGLLLELVVEDVLTDLNFHNVRRQKSGSQFGFDLVAYKKNKFGKEECWKFECKNLQGAVSVDHISPKLIWHINSQKIDRFVIVSTNGFNNDLQNLLEQEFFSFPVEIWTGEYLESLISESPKALNRLEIKHPVELKGKAVPVTFSASKIKFNTVYNEGEPYSIDYFKVDEDIVKAYTEVFFRVTASVNNTTAESAFVHQVNIKTLSYKAIDSRIVRQFKQKGIIEPIKFSFLPKPYPFGSLSLLRDGKIMDLPPSTTSYMDFKLDEDTLPGFYEFVFELVLTVGGVTKQLYSNRFSLNVLGNDPDSIHLNTAGQYYDTPVSTLLNLKDGDWSILKTRPKNALTYLGPTIFDIANEVEPDKTWKIREIYGKYKTKGKGFEMTMADQQSKIIMDLGIPVEEKIISLRDIYSHPIIHK